MKISAVIVTYNEAANIERCLQSLDFCNEIIIVDSNSSDKTVLLAKKYTNKIFLHEFNGFSDIKNIGIDKAHNEWVLSVDADEVISPALKKVILSLDINVSKYEGYYIKRNDFFLGKEIKHCGWNNDYQLRLFKKTNGRFDGRLVHESVKLIGSVGKINEPIYHYSYPDSKTYFNKMNRYTTLQAEDKKKHFLVLRMIFSPFLKFFRMYFAKLGFLDGLQGFVLSIYSGFSEFIKYSKMYEAKNTAGNNSILLKAPNWIGDAVMMTMFLKEAKRLYKKVIVVVTSPGVRAILENNSYIDNIIVYDRKNLSSTLNATATLKKEHIDVGVSFSPSISSYIFLMLAGVKLRVGYDADFGELLLHKTYKQDKTHKREHITQEYSKIMYLVNSAFDFSFSKQNLIGKSVNKTKHTKLSNKNILIAPFAIFGPSKMWPLEYYSELIRIILLKNINTTITITGIEQDKSFLLPRAITENKRFFDLRGDDLAKVIPTITNYDLFIGNDSGIMHIADAFEVPVIVIYGSTAPYWGGPIASKATQFYQGLDCQPCFEKTCKLLHYNCLKNIKPLKVYEKVCTYL